MNKMSPLIVAIHFVILIFCKSSAEETDIFSSIKQLSFENILDSVSSDSNDSELCVKHLLEVKENLKTAYWAMKMFDSSTKIPESVLSGLLVHLGNFDECIGIQNVNTSTGAFSGQHCLAPVNLTDLLHFQGSETLVKSLRHREAVLNAADHPRYKEGAAIPGIANILMAYCIPSTCSPQDFQTILNLVFASYHINISVNMEEGGECQTSKKAELSAGDWTTVGLFIILAALAVSSTAYDLIKREHRNELLCAFSWYSNGKKLLNTEITSDTLPALHGIRFLSMCWVVVGHRYGMIAAIPIINFFSLGDFLKDFWRLYVTNATLSVDSFFLLSGLLVSYIFLKQMKTGKHSFNIPLFYLHRYLRLTPPFALMMLLQATLIRHVSSGPRFPSAMNATADTCQKHWWANLLYLQNYIVDQTSICLGQSWYLAVDMQLFILSPIILYPLWKWPKKWSMSFLSALIASGLITAFTVSYVDKLNATMFTLHSDAQKLQYTPTHTRFTPWLIGIGCGYIFHEHKRTNLKLYKRFVVLGWCLGIMALLTALLGIYPFIKHDLDALDPRVVNSTKYISQFETSLYTASSRSLWAFGVAWIAYACVFGYGGPVNTFLSWKAFLPLSRMTYCVYLVHLSYQTVVAYSTRTPSYISDLTTIPGLISDVVISLFLGAILSLGIESPVIILEMHLVGGYRSKRENADLEHARSVNHYSSLEEDSTETLDKNVIPRVPSQNTLQGPS